MAKTNKAKHQEQPAAGNAVTDETFVGASGILLKIGLPTDTRKKPRLVVERPGQKLKWLKISRKVAQALEEYGMKVEEVEL